MIGLKRLMMNHKVIPSDPELGDTINSRLLGFKSNLVRIWSECPDCKKRRWVSKGNLKIYKGRCRPCGYKIRSTQYIGEKASQWKGGKIVTKYGYIMVRVYDNDKYASMQNYIGYVCEHRLVMAKHLGRPLEKSEVVHHKNNNKQDNRIENLELINSKHVHNGITYLDEHIKKLNEQISNLEYEIEDLKLRLKTSDWRIKQLESYERIS